jgi:hypothetical protein
VASEVKTAPGSCQAHVEQVESQAGDPLKQSLEGALIGDLGAKRGRALAHADVAVVELSAQRGTCLACEGDLIRSCLHGARLAASPLFCAQTLTDRRADVITLRRVNS